MVTVLNTFGEAALFFDAGANLLSSIFPCPDPSLFMTTSESTLLFPLVPVVEMCSIDFEIFLNLVFFKDRSWMSSNSSEILPVFCWVLDFRTASRTVPKPPKRKCSVNTWILKRTYLLPTSSRYGVLSRWKWRYGRIASISLISSSSLSLKFHHSSFIIVNRGLIGRYYRCHVAWGIDQPLHPQ